MPLFFFDVFDKHVTRDLDGQECVDHADARRAAFASLPEIAADEIGGEDEKRSFAVVVRDSDDKPIYTAVMTVVGQSLL